jgi:hypothetical protein
VTHPGRFVPGNAGLAACENGHCVDVTLGFAAARGGGHKNGGRAPRSYVETATRRGSFEIAAFVNAKGACSYRRFNLSGRFIAIQSSRGDFAIVFEKVIAGSRRYFPAYQPALVDAEKAGLPRDLVDAADAVVKNWSRSETD